MERETGKRQSILTGKGIKTKDIRQRMKDQKRDPLVFSLSLLMKEKQNEKENEKEKQNEKKRENKDQDSYEDRREIEERQNHVREMTVTTKGRLKIAMKGGWNKQRIKIVSLILYFFTLISHESSMRTSVLCKRLS